MPNDLWVSVKEGSLFCRISGKGAPLFILHGGPGLSSDYLLPHCEVLNQSHQLIVYDQRGCGRSTGQIDSRCINLNRYAEDLEELRLSFGFPKISILGHSLGGLIGLTYGSKFSPYISSMILMNCAAVTDQERQKFVNEVERRKLPIEMQLINSVGHDPALVEEYRHLLFSLYCRKPEDAWKLQFNLDPASLLREEEVTKLFNQSRFSSPYDFTHEMEKITCPTLIIHGAYDPIPESSSLKIHRTIKHSKYLLLESSGHFPFVEAPDILFNAIFQFYQP